MDAENIAEIFPQHFEAVPTGVWSAPGRFNLMGEHTDYNRGFCLPVPLDARTFVAARARDDDRVRLISLNIDGDVDVDLEQVDAQTPGGWGAYAAGVIWALRRAGYAVRGVDMVIGSTLLIGAGLSSSAALECSVAAAVCDLFGLDLLADDAGRKQLAIACQTAENEIALAPTGGVDQTSALRGRAGHALLIDFLTDELRPVPYRPQDAGVEVYIIDTGTRHSLSAGHYGNRRAECEQIARMLGIDYLRRIDEAGLPEAIRRLNDPTLAKRLRHVVTENARAVRMADDLETGDWRSVAEGMTTAHYSMRDDLEVSVPEVDLAVDTALAAGAWGARLVGGGFGGCVLAVMPAGRGDELLQAVSDAYDRAGYQAPRGFVGEAGSPAARDL